jgi:hypothetical protein
MPHRRRINQKKIEAKKKTNFLSNHTEHLKQLRMKKAFPYASVMKQGRTPSCFVQPRGG